jgi:hypothetical protein
VLAITGAILILDEFAKTMGFDGVADLLQSVVDTWVGIFDQFGTIIKETVETWIGIFGQVETIIDKIAGKIAGVFSHGLLMPEWAPPPGGDAAGTPWTGDMGINTPTGRTTHGQEAVIPHGGMTVHPGKDGLQLRGLGEMLRGISQSIGDVFSGIDDNLLRSITQTASPATQNAMMAAAAPTGGGGTTYSFGDINIEVPLSEDMLRDPQLVENARQFGAEAGDSFGNKLDGILRSRGN